ncbi:hypothetical protein FDH70_gp72 [Pseudomonas phage PaMx25]|jgi:hypothetical protein|uniref:Uncharacterized protein n=1 Tax=Pseudomonas phage PaMx25 TaxID=1175654 RepID=A0A0S0N8N9_9CAUD|nr:hypothetical protein FDH70_gp72 [Pseudomonas phage PaMx25]ALH23758.1 hypothetical protein PaMx25_72 [Pseudomonas phage PaMx25]
MMNRAQLLQAMQEEVLKNTVYQRRYDAALSMYQAACLDNHGQEADLNRQNLHALLDLMLDSLASVQMLQRQLMLLRD